MALLDLITWIWDKMNAPWRIVWNSPSYACEPAYRHCMPTNIWDGLVLLVVLIAIIIMMIRFYYVRTLKCAIQLMALIIFYSVAPSLYQKAVDKNQARISEDIQALRMRLNRQ